MAALRDQVIIGKARPLYLRRNWWIAISFLWLLAVGLTAWWLISRTATPRDVPSLSTLRQQQVTTLLSDLTRSGYGPTGGDVNVILGLPDYFRLTNQFDFAAQYRPDVNWVFLVTENVHYGALPDQFVPILRMDGHMQLPSERRLIADSEHHRVSAFLYARVDASGKPVSLGSPHLVELILPSIDSQTTRPILSWQLPVTLSRPGTAATGGAAMSWAAILALLGGLLASMWPCLFQLTAYFIPSLAGLSAEQVHGGVRGIALKRSVLSTAFLFVAGIIMLYTLIGALTGLAAQSLRGLELFEAARRPLAIVAGSIIILLAIRVVVKGRAPLVCKMPLFSSRSSPASTRPWVRSMRTMGLGVAFATGCMSCFGAATAIGMIAYVGTMGTPLYGAFVLFLFSLGVSIPLVGASMALAYALPMLGKLERWTPWMALISGAVMLVFGLLLVSGSYHTISNSIYRLAG